MKLVIKTLHMKLKHSVTDRQTDRPVCRLLAVKWTGRSGRINRLQLLHLDGLTPLLLPQDARVGDLLRTLILVRIWIVSNSSTVLKLPTRAGRSRRVCADRRKVLRCCGGARLCCVLRAH